MSRGWKKAAERYRMAKCKFDEKREACLKTVPIEDQQRKIRDAVEELSRFLCGSGQSGMELLRDSDQCIVLCEKYEKGRLVETFYLSGSGLSKAVAVYNDPGDGCEGDRQTKTSFFLPVTSEETVRTAVLFGAMEPLEIVLIIRKELNRIARCAPVWDHDSGFAFLAPQISTQS